MTELTPQAELAIRRLDDYLVDLSEAEGEELRQFINDGIGVSVDDSDTEWQLHLEVEKPGAADDEFGWTALEQSYDVNAFDSRSPRKFHLGPPSMQASEVITSLVATLS